MCADRTTARPAAASAPTPPVPPAFVHDVRVGRQGVYDADGHLACYTLTFAGSAAEGRADLVEPREQATSALIGATFATFGLESLADGKPVLLTLTRAFITGMLPIPVDPDNVILTVTDGMAVDRELLLGISRLKDAGYRVAVQGYRGDLSRSPLIELADVVMMDVDALPSAAVPGLVHSCRLVGATLLATNVHDAATLRRCADLGFELFQGERLGRPAVLQRRVLSPSQLICVRLLNELADPDVPPHRIEQLVGSDPGLSMRLLRSANSAAGSGKEVQSLRQALVLIGPRRLRSWIVLTLLEGNATSNASHDLWNVLARAHACQRLAPSLGDLAYTVGLLSGAADLLGTDPGSVADGAGVGADARAALVDGAGPVGSALRAVLAHEREDDDALAASGLAMSEVSRIYLTALHEALQLVHDFLGR